MYVYRKVWGNWLGAYVLILCQLKEWENTLYLSFIGASDWPRELNKSTIHNLFPLQLESICHGSVSCNIILQYIVNMGRFV